MSAHLSRLSISRAQAACNLLRRGDDSSSNADHQRSKQKPNPRVKNRKNAPRRYSVGIIYYAQSHSKEQKIPPYSERDSDCASRDADKFACFHAAHLNESAGIAQPLGTASAGVVQAPGRKVVADRAAQRAATEALEEAVRREAAAMGEAA